MIFPDTSFSCSFDLLLKVPRSPLHAASMPPRNLSSGSSSSSFPESDDCIPFSTLGCDKSEEGDEVDLHFSDGSFAFPTWWLYLSRKDESLPAPDGVFSKHPAKICVHRVKVTGEGTKTTVEITWNTGTTSPFPALWLRVLGPTKALDCEPSESRPRTPTGKNPLSGVEELTVVEKQMRDKWRTMLLGLMTSYMDEEWLTDMSASLLREMVRYAEVEAEADEVSAAETWEDDWTADLCDEGSWIEEVGDEDVG